MAGEDIEDIPLLKESYKSDISNATSSSCPRTKTSENLCPQLLAVLVASFGGLSMGFALGFSSPVVPDLEKEFGLNKTGISWFGSLVTLGAACGAPISGMSVDKFGRKPVLLLANIPMIIGYGIMTSVKQMSWIYIGRTLTGIGVGMIAVVSPLYISEITSSRMRGPLGTLCQMFIGIGVFSSYVFGIPLNYIYISLTGACISVLTVVLVIFIPETPRWCILKGKNLAATRVLRRLRGEHVNIEAEFNEIQNNICSQPNKFQYKELLEAKHLKPLCLGLSLHAFQKLVGINAVEFYTESLFQAAGFGENADIPPVAVSLISVFGSLPSALLVERLGRKPMLVTSSVILLISCSFFGVFYYQVEEKGATNLGWLPVLCLALYNFGFAMGWGPTAWLVANELFPIRIRGFACGLASVFNWMLAFLVTKCFPLLVNATSHYVGFWIFSGFCLASLIWVPCILPETKGKSLEEIEQIFI